MADRSAHAVWQGGLADGSGEVSLSSSGAAGPLAVSWPARTEDASGGKTSPEELIAAAHSSCFNMALSNVLGKAGHPPTRLETDATVTFELAGGAHISKVLLRVRGTVDGLDEGGFRQAAEDAKANCPVSKALSPDVELQLDAALA